MRRITSWLRSFFGFSRTETNAFVILLPLMLVLIFSEPAYRYWFVRQPQDYSQESKQLDSLIATWKTESDSVIEKREPSPQVSSGKLFSFDPNLSSVQELSQLGFSKSLANRIVNYRTKGGKFLMKRDLLKIYGIDSSLFEKLNPYIRLPENIVKERPQKIEKKENHALAKFNLNTADTSQLIKIYGIGPKLSLRIITYREKLGGFLSEEQLKEVYGLDSSVVKELSAKSFIEENFQPRQININTATEKELGSHPYIKYKIGKAIVAYRMQHGLFASVAELKRITLIDEKAFQKMEPYLSSLP